MQQLILFTANTGKLASLNTHTNIEHAHIEHTHLEHTHLEHTHIEHTYEH